MNTACCFTGHRNLPTNETPKIASRLESEIDKLLTQGVTDFISGGALGFDQLAAAIVVGKKKNGRNIRLIFALPCRNQSERWNEPQKEFYQQLLKEADEIIYVSEKYDAACMKRRNQYMVELSDYCICALRHEKSGTGQTVRLARKESLKIINVLI